MNISQQIIPKLSRPGRMLFLLVILQLFLSSLLPTRALAGNGHPSSAKHRGVIIFQEHQDVGPVILPNGSGTKVEYRKILFREQGAGHSPGLPEGRALHSGLDFQLGD
ncbi:MAG: hypothetical protein ACP5SH_15180 [Syntrophobacteraceae bacterium]